MCANTLGTGKTRTTIGQVELLIKANWAERILNALAPLLDHSLTSKQRAFLRTIIDHLTQNNTLDLALLYEPPFTNYHYEGPMAYFQRKKSINCSQCWRNGMKHGTKHDRIGRGSAVY